MKGWVERKMQELKFGVVLTLFLMMLVLRFNQDYLDMHAGGTQR